MSAVPLLQATLGPQDRAELMRDIEALTRVLAVQVEEAGGSRACRLDEAFAGIELGTASRALIRYSHDGFTWRDTLLAEDGVVRLVRVAEEHVLPDSLPGGDGGQEGQAPDA